MEIIAVKASGGSIRTALNTCQVCYRSGRGYYKQVGDVFVCQNCGNRFKIDQVELIKGGCNPVPILDGDKTDSGDSIGISKAYLESAAPYFAAWKKRA
jgi:Predicted membrane protein